MRPAQRFINFTRNFRSRISPNATRSNVNRRWQSTVDPASAAEGARQSTFQRMWNSPIGLKTVHFWYSHLFHFHLFLFSPVNGREVVVIGGELKEPMLIWIGNDIGRRS